MRKNPPKKFLIPCHKAQKDPMWFFAFALLIGLVAACSTMQKDWEKAQRTDTIQAYDEFLQVHLHGALADRARLRKKDLTIQEEWKTTQILDTIEAYENFLRRHVQDTVKIQAAKARIAELRMRKAWETTLRLDTSDAYEQFLKTYPTGNLAERAQKRLEELDWLHAKRANTIIVYKRFLDRHPNSDLAHQAEMSLRELYDWEEIRSANNLAEYEKFCQNHPRSVFLPEAEKQIEKLANDDEINVLRNRMESEKKAYGSIATIGIFAYKLTRGESEIIYKGAERRYLRITTTDLKPRKYSQDVWKLRYTRPLEAIILSINIGDFSDAKTINNTMNRLHRGLKTAIGVRELALLFLDPGLEEYRDTQEYIKRENYSSNYEEIVYEGERKLIPRDRFTYSIAQQFSRHELMKFAEDSNEEVRIGAVRLLNAYQWAKNKALFRFSATGEVKKVNKALESGADVNAKNILDYTPLQEAMKKGHLQVVKLLIEYGAIVKTLDENASLRRKAVRLLAGKGVAAVGDLVVALNDESAIVQKEAADALVKIGKPALSPLLKAFTAQGPTVQKRIMAVLIRMPDSDLQPLVKRLSEGDGLREKITTALVLVLQEGYNELAAHILIRMGDPRVADPLIKTLMDRSIDGKIRASVASVLPRVSDARGIRALVAVLGDRYAKLRETAASALISIGSPAVDPLAGAFHLADTIEKIQVRSKSTELEQIFLHRLLRRSSSENKALIGKTIGETACNLLIAIGPTATDSLLKGLRSEDANTRRWSARALGRIREAHGLALEPLLLSLRDSAADVKTEAAEALGIIGNFRSVDPLLDALLDESIEVRLTATFALGTPGNDKAVEPLIALMKGGNKYLAWSAESSLLRIGSSGVSAMINLLQHPDEMVSIRALWAIEKASEMPQAYNALRFALSRKSFYSSFIRNGNPSHVPLLIDALNTSGDKNMAEDFLNCGNNALEDAARDWAKRHGYQAWPRSSSTGGPIWKGHEN